MNRTPPRLPFAASRFQAESAALLPLLVEAGTMLRAGRPGLTEVRRKADHSLVTELDHRCALFLDRHLEALFPADGVLNEETHESRTAGVWRNACRCWMVDPLDSTSSFVHGGDHYGILLGLTVDGAPRLGMAYRPETRELFWAAEGEGAWLTAADPFQAAAWTRLRVSPDVEPRILVSRGRRNAAVEALLARLGHPPATAMDGSLKICEIARGPYTAFVAPPENRMSLWDVCAPHVVLAEAGGVLTALEGRALDFRAASMGVHHGLLAATPALHAWVLQRLSDAAKG